MHAARGAGVRLMQSSGDATGRRQRHPRELCRPRGCDRGHRAPRGRSGRSRRRPRADGTPPRGGDRQDPRAWLAGRRREHRRASLASGGARPASATARRSFRHCCDGCSTPTPRTPSRRSARSAWRGCAISRQNSGSRGSRSSTRHPATCGAPRCRMPAITNSTRRTGPSTHGTVAYGHIHRPFTRAIGGSRGRERRERRDALGR